MDEPDPSSLLVTNSIEVKRGTSTRSAVVVSVLVVLAGCTFSPQAPVVVKPELVAHQSCAGAGKPVYVSVVDQRPSKVLGRRGVRGVGAELTAADNFVVPWAPGLKYAGSGWVRSASSASHGGRQLVGSMASWRPGLSPGQPGLKYAGSGRVRSRQQPAPGGYDSCGNGCPSSRGHRPTGPVNSCPAHTDDARR